MKNMFIAELEMYNYKIRLNIIIFLIFKKTIFLKYLNSESKISPTKNEDY